MGAGIKKEIFKLYDIRGVYPNEINEEVALKIGRSFVEFLAKRKKGKKKLNIVVGRDCRISSRSISDKIIEGIMEGGANVVDIGFSTTPVMYFSVFHFNYDGGIQITASHNPFQYNGFKMVKEKAVPLEGKKEIQEIRKIAQKEDFKKRTKGRLLKKKVLEDYIKFNTANFSLKDLRSLKIVIDTANAVPGILIPDIFKDSSLRVQNIFERIDGSFPNHDPNPLIRKNMKPLSSKVKKEKADLGIAFDGDGDRVMFTDEKGKIVPADLILALVSEIILEEKKAKILYDLRSSNIVRETIEKGGGVPVMSRVGHSLIKNKMKREDVFFGGEFSGHYYHKSHYFCESPFFVIFTVIKKMSESRTSLSQLISPFNVYFHSGEINFKVSSPKKVIEEIEKKYEKGKISRIDGLRIDFDDWWFCVRASNTEPLLRLVLEAKTKKKMEDKKREISSLIEIGKKN
jgi:phosphomannomutase